MSRINPLAAALTIDRMISFYSHSRAYPYINQAHNYDGYITGTKITRIETFAAEIPDPSMHELMLICTIFDAQEGLLLRTTITVDDELYQRALDLADPGMDKADLFREAMKVFVRVQAAKRLSALGGQAPKMRMIPRRRPA